MRRIYLFAMILLVAAATVSPAYSTPIIDVDGEEPTTREIVIRDIQTPPITERPRSAAPIINAYYSADTDLLEVYFNYCIGTVTINVLDATQQCIARYTCNTNTEGEVYLTPSLSPGETYTLHIVGNDYEGIGYLDN